MATIDITSRFTNQDKREAELVVVTLPAILKAGGGRSQAQPVFIQGGDAHTASVVEDDSILTKMYVIIDEAFPTGAEIAIDIAGTNYAPTAIPADVVGMTVSSVEDKLYSNAQSVTLVINGVTGDVTTGKARIVMAMEHPSIANGRYAAH